MELETAVRLKCNLVHVVWIDGFYDMVGIREMAKYGRLSGVKLGPVYIVRFAEAFERGICQMLVRLKTARLELPQQTISGLPHGQTIFNDHCRQRRNLSPARRAGTGAYLAAFKAAATCVMRAP